METALAASWFPIQFKLPVVTYMASGLVRTANTK